MSSKEANHQIIQRKLINSSNTQISNKKVGKGKIKLSEAERIIQKQLNKEKKPQSHYL